jgi:hypothetical protein
MVRLPRSQSCYGDDGVRGIARDRCIRLISGWRLLPEIVNLRKPTRIASMLTPWQPPGCQHHEALGGGPQCGEDWLPP